MAAADPTDTLRSADDQPGFPYCQNEVLAAGWMKPTGSSEQRTDTHLVGPDQQQHQLGRNLHHESQTICHKRAAIQ